MLHEFGPYLILGHSTPPAVMQPEISIGEQKRSLTDDDINGIFAIYGASDCTDVDGDGWCMQIDDCDDTDPSVHPEATEGPVDDPTCSDGKDNDCDGSADAEDRDCAAGPCVGTTEASAHGSSTVYRPSSLTGHLASILLPLGAVIAIRIWRRRRQ